MRRVLLAACMHVREDGIVGKVATLDKVFAQMDPITDTMQHTVRLLLDREVQQFQTCWVLMGGLIWFDGGCLCRNLGCHYSFPVRAFLQPISGLNWRQLQRHRIKQLQVCKLLNQVCILRVFINKYYPQFITFQAKKKSEKVK